MFPEGHLVEHWLDITDLPAEGRDFTFSDQDFWAEGWREFHMDIRPQTPLSADFMISRDQRGAFVRGRLTGSVLTACDRCGEDARVEVDQPFDLYEEPGVPGEDAPEPSLIRLRGKRMELDVGAMLWEELVLALPVKPLCGEDCKGLCLECGANLNQGPCPCGGRRPDVRLSALHSIQIVKKS